MGEIMDTAMKSMIEESSDQVGIGEYEPNRHVLNNIGSYFGVVAIGHGDGDDCESNDNGVGFILNEKFSDLGVIFENHPSASEV